MKRVAIYLRVSTLEQATDGFGLDSQERILKAFIEANKDNDWVLGNNLIYKDEGISGASDVEYRPSLTKLKKDIIDGKIDIVLVWKIDRLFRKTRYLLEFIEFIKKYDVNFISKNENIDLKTHTGNLVLTMIGAIAEMERETIQERTTEGKISKALQGYFIYGNPPFGYEKYHDGKGNKLKINEKQAELIKKIYHLFLNENKTASYIREYLSGLNLGDTIKTSSRIKNDENFIHYSFVYDVLTNEAYTGKYFFRKTKNKLENGKNKSVLRDKKDWLYLEIDKIVDEKNFKKVQEKLNKAKVLNGKGESHLFTGLLKCSECGKSFVHYKSKKGTSNYRCNGRRKSKISKDLLCDNPDISEIKIVDIILNKILPIFKNPNKFIDEFIKGNSNQDEIIKTYSKELLEVESKMNEKNIIIKNGIKKQLLDEDNYKLYDEIILETTKEKKDLEQRKNEVEEKLKDIKSIDEIKDMIQEVSKIYNEKYDKLTIEDKVFIVNSIVKEVLIGKDDIKIVYRFSL